VTVPDQTSLLAREQTVPRRSSTVDVRRATAVAAGKLSATATRLLGKGGGTALPGLVAARLDPRIVRDLSAQLTHGSVVVSGTNGKTTTARMLGAILSDASFAPLRNTAGSNLMRGLASSLISHTNVLGNLSAAGDTLGLFEADEAALPEVLTTVAPKVVLLLNLFRDQLDRYGEVATVARLWSEAIGALSSTTTVVANGDDPLVADASASAASSRLFFGIESAGIEAGAREHASDVKACPRCGERIEYTAVFLGHMGHYRCSTCNLRRPTPDVYATDIRLLGVTGSEFELVAPAGIAHIVLPLPGLYNVYNAVGAAATASILGIEPARVAASLRQVTPAFGRMEQVRIDDRTAFLALAKNPAGLNQILRTLLTVEQPISLLVMLNDNIADGRDVSWIWDADVEMLDGFVSSAVFAGTRAEDIALRFKYAGVIGAGSGTLWEINRATERALRRAVELTPPGKTLFVVPTYTALLDVRNTLSRLGYVKPYWDE
jgi:lipid II isoglutaminyl synthase (glutamine-hydrolysing)